MPITINSSGGGSITLNAPSTGSTFTHTLPAESGTVITTSTTSGINASALSVGSLPSSAVPTSGINAASLTVGTMPQARFPSGHVIQVVNVKKTSVTSISSGSWTDVSGMSASITPISTSNKILILISTNYSGYASSPALRLVRDSTALDIGDAGGSTNRAWIEIGRAHV